MARVPARARRRMHGRLRPRTAAIACGISFALAVLTKGPLGLALPIAVIGGDALVTSRGKFWKLPIPWGWGALGFALAVAIPLAWYLPAYKAGGYEFLKTCVVLAAEAATHGDGSGRLGAAGTRHGRCPDGRNRVHDWAPRFAQGKGRHGDFRDI